MLGFSNRWTTGGKAEMLTDQLRHKFGRLPAGAEQRIAGATERQINVWGEAVLTASSPTEVFAARRRKRQ